MGEEKTLKIITGVFQMFPLGRAKNVVTKNNETKKLEGRI